MNDPVVDKIKTRYGEFLPCSDASDLRKKYRCTVDHHKNGNLKSIYLQDPETVSLPEGDFQAELMTFYEDGSIKRVFPLYGQLSAYWSLEDEQQGAPYYDFRVEGEVLRIRPHCLFFYPSGKLRSITLWPNDKITVRTSAGPVETKLGVEFYENGRIRSIEPVIGTTVKTPWGDVSPYIYRPVMFHAENSSMTFDEDGRLSGFSTIKNGVEADGIVYRPGGYMQPLTVRLDGDTLHITGHVTKDIRVDSLTAKVRFL